MRECVIFDLDGTFAFLGDRSRAYDASRAEHDRSTKPSISSMRRSGAGSLEAAVLLVSGRRTAGGLKRSAGWSARDHRRWSVHAPGRRSPQGHGGEAQDLRAAHSRSIHRPRRVRRPRSSSAAMAGRAGSPLLPGRREISEASRYGQSPGCFQEIGCDTTSCPRYVGSRVATARCSDGQGCDDALAGRSRRRINVGVIGERPR